MNNFSSRTDVTIFDLRNCGWKAAINGWDRDGYFSLCLALFAAAKSTYDDGQESSGYALWLMASACELTLTPASTNKPFNACSKFALEDFRQSEIAGFAEFSEEIDEPWLQARIADLAWLLSTPRVPALALLAIDAYRRVPLNLYSWLRDGRECWERALVLGNLLGGGAGNRLAEMKATILIAFNGTASTQGYLGFWLSELLLSQTLEDARFVEIAEKLELMAMQFQAAIDHQKSRDYFEAAASWYKRSKNVSKAIDMTICRVEGWVKEAEIQPLQTLAIRKFEKAIQVYRLISKVELENRGANGRVGELHIAMRNAGKLSLSEMPRIKTNPIDISDTVASVQRLVSGKPIAIAIGVFANFYEANEARARKTAETTLKQSPLSQLFSTSQLTHDGRISAKTAAVGANDPQDGAYKTMLWHEMVRGYQIEINYVVQAEIWPALKILNLEHRFREQDLVAIAKGSPLVPLDRIRLVGRALYMGFDGDFATALHLMIPQIENMVRTQLQAREIKTSTLKDGIETENGLSALVKLPEVKEIFGDNIAFELEALFCGPVGPNLRNELAHGLLSDARCQTSTVVYAWWFGLKLVFNTFWNAGNSEVV